MGLDIKKINTTHLPGTAIFSYFLKKQTTYHSLYFSFFFKKTNDTLFYTNSDNHLFFFKGSIYLIKNLFSTYFNSNHPLNTLKTLINLFKTTKNLTNNLKTGINSKSGLFSWSNLLLGQG